MIQKATPWLKIGLPITHQWVAFAWLATSIQQNEQPESLTEEHDKEFIEDQEAFTYQAQLRGFPYDSFLQREDTIDATTDVFTVAPGEDQKPTGILNN